MRSKRLCVLVVVCSTVALAGGAASVQAQEADSPAVGLRLVADGFTSPVALVSAGDGSGRRFVVDQVGLIRVLRPDGTLAPVPFLDLRSRIVPLDPGFDERGLLGLAFHPRYASNGRFFVYYSAPLRAGAPAGYLYLSIGDGGGADDVGLGHVEDWYAANEGGNGQDIQSNLFGNILRLDVDAGDPYAIPADNPFTATPGCPDGCDEIWAYGFRNPYRMSFDLGGNRQLFVGDAGQELWEEVSIAVKGGNFGWNVKEGTHCFSTQNPDESPAECPDVVGSGHPRAGDPLIDPVIEYANHHQPGGLGATVIGGHVYRGRALPQFFGRYVFGDWSREFEEPDGSLFVAKPRKKGLWRMQQLKVATSATGRVGSYVLGFGQDLAGEMYVLTTDMTGPAGTTGKVYRLVRAGAPAPNGPKAPARKASWYTGEKNLPAPGGEIRDVLAAPRPLLGTEPR